jgi:hypothetical protein
MFGQFGQSQPGCRPIIGDRSEGQIEGQNGAGEGLREPVAASVSWLLAWSGRIWPGRWTGE